jgi:hypothetical protein
VRGRAGEAPVDVRYAVVRFSSAADIGYGRQSTRRRWSTRVGRIADRHPCPPFDVLGAGASDMENRGDVVYNGIMSVVDKDRVKAPEPEVLDAATLAAIDKAGRWDPNAVGITFDEALERARKRNKAWRNAHPDQKS